MNLTFTDLCMIASYQWGVIGNKTSLWMIEFRLDEELFPYCMFYRHEPTTDLPTIDPKGGPMSQIKAAALEFWKIVIDWPSREGNYHIVDAQGLRSDIYMCEQRDGELVVMDSDWMPVKPDQFVHTERFVPEYFVNTN